MLNRIRNSFLFILQHNLIMKALSLIVAAIAFYISFNGYAGSRAVDLDADQAIHILMAADLQLPEDLYYWGQQRGGSIIPVLGNFLLKHSTLSPVEAVSYAQYFILGIGYLAFASIFKTNIARILFALVWFLPPHPFGFLLMLGHPYSAQLAFLGLAVALIEKLPRKPDFRRVMLRHLMIVGAVVCLFISVWASDFTVISMVLISILAVLAILYRVWTAPVTPFFTTFPKLLKIALLVVLLALEVGNVVLTSRYGVQFIRYAKAQAVSDGASLTKLNSPEQAKTLFNLFTQPITQAIALKNDRLQDILVVSILAFWGCAAVFLMVYGLVWLLNVWLRKSTMHRLELSPWIWVLLANVVIGFFAIILSEWVYINSVENGSGKRYFVPLYILGWVAALLFTEGIPKLPAKPLWVILFVVAVTGSATLPGSVYGLEQFQPTVVRLQEIQQLGPVGIIGNHWSAYLLCSVNPRLQSCTQFDEYGQKFCPSSVEPTVRRPSGRCFRCVERVLNSQTIYLVKDFWLEEFPEETEQFGECLVKIGEPMQLAGYTLAPYRRRNLLQSN
jgi:hypothetical protein